jgi:hypothetical protein
MFSARIADYSGRPMLNICDADLLGRELVEGNLSLRISQAYYGGRMMDRREAEEVLRSSSVINMAGEEIVSLSTAMGVGTREGVRTVSGVPFLIVLKM